MVSISTPSETSLHQQNLKPKRMQSDQTTRSAGDFPIADSEIPFLGFSNRPETDAQIFSWLQLLAHPDCRSCKVRHMKFGLIQVPATSDNI